jgi:hypothetical protein
MNSWINAIFLSLNFNKTYLQFRTKNDIDNILYTNYLNKIVANLPYTKFQGLLVGDIVLWNNHIDQFISKLNFACYAMRAVNATLSCNVIFSVRSFYHNLWNSILGKYR